MDKIEETLPLTLDHNGQIPVTVTNGGDNLRFSIDLSNMEDPQTLGNDRAHFQEGMKLYADGHVLAITPIFDAEHGTLTFDGIFPPETQQLTLKLYGQPVLSLYHVNSSFVMDHEYAHERLTVDELRMLATSDVRLDHVPTPRHLFEGFDPKKHAPITDLHIHSSAQLSNAALMALALKHNLDYPVELLGKLNIELTPKEKGKIKEKGGLGARFSPLEHEEPKLDCETQNRPCDVIPLTALTPAHQARLQAQLQVPQDMTLSFSDFDRAYYRFVNPLVKNPKMTKDMILSIAEDYKAHGVRYAELSTASMLNLDSKEQATWFKEMIEAVKQAEEKTGVQLRFLIGVPRSYGPAKVMAELEKIKYAARHPLIAGVDLLGYESNRTSDFTAALSHIADWARAAEGTELAGEKGWDFKRDFTIRIHAGETGKNTGNVAEAVRIAEKFGVRVRVAHAINEASDPQLDAKILELSSRKPPLLSMEFCPASNLAYNNIQDLREVPFKRWLKCCKSWFLGTDGSGAIQTTPTQLALGALAGGVSLDQLAEMRANEERFIADAQKAFTLKTKAYEHHYGVHGKDADVAFLKEMAAHIKHTNDLIDPKKLDPIHPELPQRFHGRMPILIAGASGDSAKHLNEKTREEIRRAMHMLVASVDPQKAYFVVGRSKSDGVTAALDEAIMEHNRDNPMNKFHVLALITEDIPDLPRSISWVVPQKGMRDNVPTNIIEFMRGNLRPGKIPGISVFIGGSNFTGDMILKCRQSENLAYLLMENAKGASQAFASKTSAVHKFNSGKSLLNRIAGLFSDRGPLAGTDLPFRDGVDVHNDAVMDQLFKGARAAALRTSWRRAADVPPMVEGGEGAIPASARP